MMNYASPIIGRRAVYSNPRETHKGTIVAIGWGGQTLYARVVMLYDDGTLHEHSLEYVTLEAPQTEGVYR